MVQKFMRCGALELTIAFSNPVLAAAIMMQSCGNSYGPGLANAGLGLDLHQMPTMGIPPLGAMTCPVMKSVSGEASQAMA